MIERNPKQEGSRLFDCRPQIGVCPNRCNQCFYNREGAYYQDISHPSIPTPEEVGEGIVRMNCGHDSNINRELVIETSKQYKHVFFNTSIPRLDFPGPVVLTANPEEESFATVPFDLGGVSLGNLMFVRLRVSATNLNYIEQAVDCWTRMQIPVVLTFMAYYDKTPPGTKSAKNLEDSYVLKDQSGFNGIAYTWKKRILNSYYCPTEDFMQYVVLRMKHFIGDRLITRCGSNGSSFCKDCRNCETYYWQTKKHMEENNGTI